MNLKRTMIFTVFFVAFFAVSLLAGCGNDGDAIYLETAASEQADQNGTMHSFDAQAAENTAEGTENNTASGKAASDTQADECVVYVCGAVKQPGVYTLPKNSRVYEAIEMAGGLLETAGAEAVNQAEEIFDGQMLRIPTQEEAEAFAAAGEPGQNSAAGEADALDGRINLNTATAAELMTLPGIGQSKADSIIAYRTEHGGFSAPEEIMKIEGIKEGVYNRIKDGIKVK